MKNTLNKIAFLLLLLVIAFSGAYAIPDDGNNCSSQTTGSFSFRVENPIQVEVDHDFIDVGDICPGCNVQFTDCDCPNIIYTVSGGTNCYFVYQAIEPEAQGGVTVDFHYYYFSNHGWIRAKTTDKYSFDENGEAQIMACVREMWADCTAEAGPHVFPLTILVQYTCGSY